MKKLLLFVALMLASPAFVGCEEGDTVKQEQNGGSDNKPEPKPEPEPEPTTGHEWVDLGLSVKWATCNVGASSPSDYGSYFAWGETSAKSSYTEANSKTHNRDMGSIAGDSSYDAARANWGGNWRLPTEEEREELDRCTWTWTTQGGHNGYKVMGPNGNSIFLPAAGYRYGESHYRAGERGYYWSASATPGDAQHAFGLYFGSGGHFVYWGDRSYGLSVRPVLD
uniref:hypothetical protein n=1 Tax=Alistipes sp. TaxID=1872444 RepID=UPI0040560787